MKNIITLILLTFFSFAGYSQTPDSSKTGKTEIGIGFSPDYCFRTLKADAGSMWITEIRDTLECRKYGYTTGLNVVFNIYENIFLSVGVLFSDKGEKTKKYSLGNPISGKMPVYNTFIYHYRYLDIPVHTSYYILTGKKVRFFLTAGVSANMFLGQKTTSLLEFGNGEMEKSNSRTGPEFSKINLALIAGMGIDCPLTNNYTFKLEPLYRRSLTPIIDAPVKEYLYSAGLNVGIYYKF